MILQFAFVGGTCYCMGYMQGETVAHNRLKKTIEELKANHQKMCDIVDAIRRDR
jgi:hypothetical protein